jgi:hypothetical protein
MRGPAVVYVGNLPNDIKERELQELFDKVSAPGDRDGMHAGSPDYGRMHESVLQSDLVKERGAGLG